MSALPSSLLNITARPRPQIVVLDQDPSEIRQSSSIQNDNVCPVCQEREARYTCPKCRSAYCSVACYKKHNNCTEEFYKDRVSQVLELEVTARKNETMQILNRIHQSGSNNIPREQLLQVLKTLEDGNDEDIEKMMKNPMYKDAFENAIQNDNLHEWILQPWHPWWKNDLGSCTDGEDDENSCDNSRHDSNHIETIDERLSSVPKFHTLWPVSKNKRPELEFNTIDMIYSYAWTLRFFHGVENAKEVAIQSTSHLVQSSAVLSRDARFDSLEQVLSDRTAASTQAECLSLCNSRWTTLGEDVSCICTTPRLIGRALLEMIELINTGASEAKRANDKGSSLNLRKTRKKIEFYLSWTQEHSARVTKLAPQINYWISTWESDETKEPKVKIDPLQKRF